MSTRCSYGEAEVQHMASYGCAIGRAESPANATPTFGEVDF